MSLPGLTMCGEIAIFGVGMLSERLFYKDVGEMLQDDECIITRFGVRLSKKQIDEINNKFDAIYEGSQ